MRAKASVGLTALILLLFVTFAWSGFPVNLIKSPQGYTLDFEIGEWQSALVDTLGFVAGQSYSAERFTTIRVPGYGAADEAGKPALPFLSFYMAISALNQVPSFEILNPVEEVVTLTNRYFPAQTPWAKNQTIADRRFSIDHDYYASAGKREATARVAEVFTIRGIPCINVHISPFAYNPAENRVTVLKRFTLKINTLTATRHSGLDSKTFENYLRYMLVNFNDAVAPVQNRARAEDYLIITGTQWESGLSSFVSFRQSRFNVKTVTTAQAGSSASAIQSYIKGVSPVPTYLLLVGDVADIPAGGSSPASDLTYSSTDSDIYPEIILGRFSVSNATELSNLIQKTIFMETKLGTIAKKNVFIGGADAGNGQIAEGTHNYVISTFMDPKGYTNTKRYCNSSTVSKTDVIADINPGVIFAVYSGHGGNTSWAAGDFSLSNTDVKALTNTTSYPFAYGFACYTGTYTDNECFTEAATRTAKGFVTCAGSSVSSYWGPDDEMERGIYKAVFAATNPQTSVGASFNAGKMSLTSSKDAYHKQYNLFGDPALSMLPINTSPYISVSFPNGGEQLEQGTTQTVLWNDNIDGNVKIEVLKGAAVKEVLAAATPSDGSFDWNIAPGYDPGTDYKIRITSVDSTALFDVSDNNFSIVTEYYIKCPYFQPFDTLVSGNTVLPTKWEQLITDDIDWIALSGPTPSKTGSDPDKTGPSSDHTTGSGKYIYIEATGSSNSPDKKADCITPKFNFKTLSNPELTFWYHLFSANNEMGDLYLDICVDGAWKNDVVHLTDNHGDQWIKQTVPLYGYNGERVIFRFRGITGSSWCSDICIDDFRIDGSSAIQQTPDKLSGSFDLRCQGSRIYYRLPENEGNRPVTLSLYNSAGRMIKKLVLGNRGAGYHSVDLQSLSANGRGLGTGLYMCTLEAGNFKKSVRIILTK